MITEHNYTKLWLLRRDGHWLTECGGQTDDDEKALCFAHLEDAKRHAKRTKSRIVKIELPFQLEYEIAPRLDCWQKMRTYRTDYFAISGLDKYARDVTGTSLGNRVWRVVDVKNGSVIAQTQPNTASTGQERDSAHEPALSSSTHVAAQGA